MTLCLVGVITLAIINKGWMSVRGFWLDPWEYVGLSSTFTSEIGEYKADRTLWLLIIREVLGVFGITIGAWFIALFIVFATVLTLEKLCNQIKEIPRFWALATFALAPGFHGVGGWFSPAAAGGLMTMLVVLLLVKWIKTESYEVNSARTSRRGFLYLALVCAITMVWTMHYPPHGLFLMIVDFIAVWVWSAKLTPRIRLVVGRICFPLVTGVFASIILVSVIRLAIGQSITSFEQYKKTVEIISLLRDGTSPTLPISSGWWLTATYLVPSVTSVLLNPSLLQSNRLRLLENSRPEVRFVHLANRATLVVAIVLWSIGIPLLAWEYLCSPILVLGTLALGLTINPSNQQFSPRNWLGQYSEHLLLIAIILWLAFVSPWISTSLSWISTMMFPISCIAVLAVNYKSFQLSTGSTRMLLTAGVLVAGSGVSGFSGNQDFTFWREAVGHYVPKSSGNAYQLNSNCNRNLLEFQFIDEVVSLANEHQASQLVVSAVIKVDECVIDQQAVLDSARRAISRSNLPARSLVLTENNSDAELWNIGSSLMGPFRSEISPSLRYLIIDN